MKRKLRSEFRAKQREGEQSEAQIKQAKRQYGYVLSTIKKLKKARELKISSRKQHNEQMKFKKDPWRYAKDLFHPPSAGQPTFTVDAATEYFTKVYKDEARSAVFKPLPGWKRPHRPTKLFDLNAPKLDQLKEAVRKKRNRNAPGLNSIPFLVYKRCPELLKYLNRIFRRVWESREIPKSWQCALVVLIAKSEVLDSPAEFRPIALLNAEGRLFFTLMQWRLSDFMLKNGYINSKVQKGFMAEVAGCVEHSETMYRMLTDAKNSKRDLCVCWIDLANAYGSVKHALFQFALEWYHVPSQFCEVIFNYYEGLMAAVVVGELTTAWFRFMIGVFQGCTASTILFNVAFNSCFDHLEEMSEECGYHFSKSNIKLLMTGYADDLGLGTGASIGSSAIQNNQRVVDSLNVWLKWSHMKAKPKKCVAMALVRGEITDPQLTIQVDSVSFPMAFISDIEYEGKSRDPWFKFLGRFLTAKLTEEQAKEVLLKMVKDAEVKIESSALRGSQKVWIWDSYVMSMISWILLIHDIAPSWVEVELAPIQIRCFCRWLGFPLRGTNKTIFFRSREHHGLQLKEMCSWHKKSRLVRRHLLATSKDSQVLAIHEDVSKQQRRRAENNTNEWKDCEEMRSLVHVVMHEKMRGPLKQGRAGLGWGSKCAQKQSPEKEERQAILRVFQEETEHKLIVDVITNLDYFGDWTKWESALQLDSRWHNLLAVQSDNMLKFQMLVTEDQFPTPSRLNMWGEGNGMCPLGCRRRGTLLHILCACQVTMMEEPQSRITWRHDSILFAIFRAVLSVLNRVKNSLKAKKLSGQPDEQTVSVFWNPESGEKYPGKVRAPKATTVLEKASDWKLLFDVTAPTYGQTKNQAFPAEIMAFAGKRPDGVIWSMRSKTVIWIELTSPWEDNMPGRHEFKMHHYNQLRIDCESKGWKVVPLCVEVGCRGRASEPFHTMCRVLGFTRGEERDLKYEVELTATHCSYAILLARYQRIWQPRALLDVSKWK